MEVIISWKISVLVGVKVVKDEVEDAIFINPFFLFLKKGPKSSDLLIMLWFLFLRFQSRIMEAGWEISEDKSVLFYDGIWIMFS